MLLAPGYLHSSPCGAGCGGRTVPPLLSEGLALLTARGQVRSVPLSNQIRCLTKLARCAVDNTVFLSHSSDSQEAACVLAYKQASAQLRDHSEAQEGTRHGTHMLRGKISPRWVIPLCVPVTQKQLAQAQTRQCRLSLAHISQHDCIMPYTFVHFCCGNQQYPKPWNCFCYGQQHPQQASPHQNPAPSPAPPPPQKPAPSPGLPPPNPCTLTWHALVFAVCLPFIIIVLIILVIICCCLY